MDLQERIARRRSARQGRRIVVDRDQLSPVVHRPEPVGRGPVLEQLLDALEPIFDGELPPPVAIVGPAGSGTSAVVTAMFDALNDQFGGSSRANRDDDKRWTNRAGDVVRHRRRPSGREPLRVLPSGAVGALIGTGSRERRGH